MLTTITSPRLPPLIYIVIYMVINSVRLAVGEVFNCTRSLFRLSFFVYALIVARRCYSVNTKRQKKLKKVIKTGVEML